MTFLANNWGTLLIAAILTIIIVAVIIKMYKDKQKGQTSCGCGCQDCPSASLCHKK